MCNPCPHAIIQSIRAHVKSIWGIVAYTVTIIYEVCNFVCIQILTTQILIRSLNHTYSLFIFHRPISFQSEVTITRRGSFLKKCKHIKQNYELKWYNFNGDKQHLFDILWGFFSSFWHTFKLISVIQKHLTKLWCFIIGQKWFI